MVTTAWELEGYQQVAGNPCIRGRKLLVGACSFGNTTIWQATYIYICEHCQITFCNINSLIHRHTAAKNCQKCQSINNQIVIVGECMGP